MEDINVIICDNCLHIEDSYKVSKHEMDAIIDAMYEEFPDIELWNRNRFSMYCEWVVHNFLFNIGVQRARTKDVDIDYPCDKPEWVYILLGILVFPFVK